MNLIPGSGKSTGGGYGNPVFLPGEFHGQRSLAGHSPWVSKQLDTTEQLNNNSYTDQKNMPVAYRSSISATGSWHFQNEHVPGSCSTHLLRCDSDLQSEAGVHKQRPEFLSQLMDDFSSPTSIELGCSLRSISNAEILINDLKKSLDFFLTYILLDFSKELFSACPPGPDVALPTSITTPSHPALLSHYTPDQ